MTALDVLAAALLLVGAVIVTLGCVGLQRFDDVYARIHAASKASTLGVVLIMLGAALRAAQAEVAVKLLLAVVLQLVTAPIAAHLIGRAAYRTGTELGARTTVDELADAKASRDPME
jgi:multicomponent Na+:H+ antiporter subunit G